MTPEAERFNGWAAMLGFVAAVGAYVTTGQIIPGWFQVLAIIKIQLDLPLGLLINTYFLVNRIFNIIQVYKSL